jgi:hypothetical protein
MNNFNTEGGVKMSSYVPTHVHSGFQYFRWIVQTKRYSKKM